MQTQTVLFRNPAFRPFASIVIDFSLKQLDRKQNELLVLRALEPLFACEFFWNYGTKAPDQFIALIQEPLIGKQILGHLDPCAVYRLLTTCSSLWKFRVWHRVDVSTPMWTEISIAKIRWDQYRNQIQDIENWLRCGSILKKPKRPPTKLLCDRDWKTQKRAWKRRK